MSGDHLEIDVRTGRTGECRLTSEVKQLSAKQTAVVICDMWDSHWCRGASARVNEMAPAMDKLVRGLRGRGCLIAHAPSDTMAFYAHHPARIRTLQLAQDQQLTSSDAGEDRLAAEPAIPVDPHRVECDCGPVKCSQHMPWRRQTDAITITGQDLIGEGKELLQAFCSQSIKHVLVMGVHANICVVGRDFGIRSLIRFGFQPLLVRDLTDCMAPSDEYPYINHFDALDYVLYHIETYLCGTVLSSQLDRESMSFHFAGDNRPGPASYAAYLSAAEHFRTVSGD